MLITLSMRKELMNSPGIQFYTGLILGPTGLMILDLIFGNDRYGK